jgi:capsular exopolysaccharide synthesis family protein
MSRIHEALKKAAEERAAQLAAGSEGNLADVPSELELLMRGPEFTRPAVSTQDTARGNGNTVLCFEELAKRCAKLEWQLDPHHSVFINSRPGQEGPEWFRTLRSRLYRIAATRQLKRVLLTSGVAGEGKTFVAFNLAQSIAQQPELRVLLVDTDLRSPRFHHWFGAPICPGLSDYLRGDVDEYAIVQKGMNESLFLIPGGSLVSNPSELLLTERMKQLLDRLTPLFDWIILDSPPSLSVHDAGILADLADGVLLVMRAGFTDARIAERAAAEFRGKNLLGVVLNQVEKSDSHGAEDHNDYYGRGIMHLRPPTQRV